MKNIILSTFLVSFVFISSLKAQQLISYDQNTFDECVIRDASVADKTISIRIYEKDIDHYSGDAPEGLGLLISVEFSDKIKFPITASDHVVIDMTRLQVNQQENQSLNSQVLKMDQEGLKKEAQSLQQEKKSVEELAREISQQMMEGKISPEDAANKIEALSSGMLNQIASSDAINAEVKEMAESNHCSITFYDTIKLEEANMYSGELRILQFNEKVFEAQFRGEFYTECLEKRMASSSSNEKQCKGQESKSLPGLKVLKEGTSSGIVKFNILEFQNNQ